jgi:thymidylate synthase (FAD)
MDSHAQHEIRMFANVIGKIISELYPQTWQAFLDYRFEAITLTRQDAMAIGNWLRDHDMDLDLSGALEYGVHPTKREQSEFLDKLQKICKGE